jgi:putative Mg2+ transporter-C (MgtC) family protein
MDLKVYLVRFAVSVIVGGLIGLERQLEHKPAGLRTIILVCLGSTIFMLIAMELRPLDADTGKIIAGIITGIGFLGAGAIIRSGPDVHGLTTAATIWLASGLGIAIGAGYYMLALIAAVLTLVVLRVLGMLEHALTKAGGKQ